MASLLHDVDRSLIGSIACLYPFQTLKTPRDSWAQAVDPYDGRMACMELVRPLWEIIHTLLFTPPFEPVNDSEAPRTRTAPKAHAPRAPFRLPPALALQLPQISPRENSPGPLALHGECCNGNHFIGKKKRVNNLSAREGPKWPSSDRLCVLRP